MLHWDVSWNLNAAALLMPPLRKPSKVLWALSLYQSTIKRINKLSFIVLVHWVLIWSSATWREKKSNKTNPPTLKNTIRKWKFCSWCHPFCTVYRVSGDYKKKRKNRTKKLIPYSKIIRYPIPHSTITIDLFLGNALSYQVDFLNCPRKLAALLQLKIAFTSEAE